MKSRFKNSIMSIMSNRYSFDSYIYLINTMHINILGAYVHFNSNIQNTIINLNTSVQVQIYSAARYIDFIVNNLYILNIL